jgi:hypothetical protein
VINWFSWSVRGYRVGDGVVDADPADRGHRVRSVAYTQPSRQRPPSQPVGAYRQQFDLFLIGQRVEAGGQERNSPGNAGSECR